MPSSSRHTSASSASWPATWRSGSAWWAIRRKSCAAGLASTSDRRRADRRHGQRRNGHDLLRRQPQRDPAGHEQREQRDLVEEPHHGGRSVGTRLHVVQDDERGTVDRLVRLVGVGLSHQPDDGGHQAVGRLALGHLVEVDLALAGVADPRPSHDGYPGLARAAEAGEGHQPGVRILEGAGKPVDQLVSSECRGAGNWQLSDRAGHRLVREARVASGVLAQDRGLEALQHLAGLDAELAGEAGSRVGVHLERFFGPVVLVQRGHQLAPQPFTGGVLADCLSQLVDRLGVPAERQCQLEAVLDGGQPLRGEPLRHLARERHVLDAGQRRPPPERQGALERGQRVLGLLVTGLGDEPTELQGVDVAGLDAETQALRADLERRPGALGPDPLDQRGQRPVTVGRDQRSPQGGSHRLRADGLAGAQREHAPPARVRACRPGSAARRRPGPGPVREARRARRSP